MNSYYQIGNNLMRYDGQTYYRTDADGAWVRDPTLIKRVSGLGEGDAKQLTRAEAQMMALVLFPFKKVDI